jgi:hypothetical protein
VICVEIGVDEDPVAVPAETIVTPVAKFESVLYSNSTLDAAPLGLTFALSVAAVVVSTFVAASVLTVGEFASSAVKT